MKIHIATVGITKEPITIGLRHFARIDVDKVYFITSKNCLDNAKQIKEELKGYDIEILELINPFEKDSLQQIIDLIVNLVNKNKDSDFYINITGGTNLMGAAALAAAYFVKANAYYILDTRKGVDERESKVDLPIPKINYLDALSPTKKELLKKIYEQTKSASIIINLKKFADSISISKQALNNHIHELEKMRLIGIDRGKKEHKIILRDEGRIIIEFLK
tara:strand:- start:6014 stop:6673 length:660 start_codon:yes stop_codon:yes gene_type:complete